MSSKSKFGQSGRFALPIYGRAVLRRRPDILLPPLFLLLILFLFAPLCPAARAADTNLVITGWLSSQTNLHLWKAGFIQTRSLRTLSRPLTTTGQLWFAVPNQFRWEIGSPPQTIALRRADEMYVIYPRLKRAERYPLDKATLGEWRDALSLLEAGFPKSRADLDERFRVLSLAETNQTYVLALQPKAAAARRIMPEIRIGLAAGTFTLASTELLFTDGSTMRNDFTNSIVNPPGETGVFDWQPPADYKITSPFAK